MLTNRCYALAALLVCAPAFGQVMGYPGQVGLTPPPSNSKPEDRCVLQGRVTNALTGEPLKKAAVRLTRQMTVTTDSPTAQQGYSTTSEADGSFKIENIEPGNYHLSGNRSGYLDTQYGAKGAGQRGSTITLRPAQQLANINLALTPQAVISGKVVDQDGDPVSNAMVQLVGQMWQRGKLRHMMQNGSNSNDLGEYRIANVRPGKYYLVVQRMRFPQDTEASPEAGKPDIRPVKTFYPEAPNLSSATPLDVKAGQDLSGMDIRLRSAATYHIRGKIVGTVPEGASDRLTLNASARDEQDMMSFFGGGTTVTKDHTFDLAGISPGSYTLNLFTMGGQLRTLGRQDVDVGQGDVNDVQVMIVPPGTLRGQISVEGNPPTGSTPANLKNVRVFLGPADMSMMMFGNNNVTPKDDGSFTMENVSPGKYYVNTNSPSGTYLKSVRFGNQDILGKELDLTQGSGQVTLIFSYGVAEVDGTVQFPQTTAASSDSSSNAQPNATPDASIVLVPETLHEDGSGMHFGNSGSGGSFTVKQVPPGHYRAYAFEKPDYQQMQNPDVLKQLESKGTDVELKENDKKQIQLPLITADDMQQIYLKLGLDVPQD
ncbi:MAG TPA: carboxypeptidase-like regulatory domain-containing protein [Bryobacteraceae bacterium]|nr:carboxypeptidase-like regulatory domain-containing protein [Bryobacteraceae bacterium]